jgi:hypothetical protein
MGMFYAAKLGMKASLKKLLPLTLLGIAVTSLFSVQPAQGFTVTLEQMGSNVVVTGSGAFNLTGLSFGVTGNGNLANIDPNIPEILTGPTGGHSADFYTGFTGPTSFGSGSVALASSGSGDFFGIQRAPVGLELLVPAGYMSGNALSGSSTYNGATFASLGVTPGSTNGLGELERTRISRS